MDKKNSSSGIGFTSLLTIVFIVLKLTGVIDWSWWWVLSPILIDIALTIIIIVCLSIYTSVLDKKYENYSYLGERKKDKWRF
jgi:hypothetical protein